MRQQGEQPPPPFASYDDSPLWDAREERLTVSLPPLPVSRQSQDLWYPPDQSDEEDDDEVDEKDHHHHHRNEQHHHDTESNADWSREDGGSWSDPCNDSRSVQSIVHAQDDMATEEGVEVSTGKLNVTKPSAWSMFSAWLLGTSLARMFQDDDQSPKRWSGAVTTKQRGQSDHSSLDITQEISLEEELGEKSLDKQRTRNKGDIFGCCCCNPYVAAVTLCCLIVAIVLIAVLGRGIREKDTASVDFQSSTELGDSIGSLPPSASPITAETLSPTTSSVFPVSFPPTAPPVGNGQGQGATAPPTISPTANALVESPMYQTNTSTSQLMVGAYYYPWHGSNFHNNGGYVRSQLVPQQFPTLGEYDDTDPDTIRQHLEWSQQANIGLWVTSWWGPERLNDSTTLNVILNHENLGDMKIALHYETTGRISESSNYSTTNVVSDIAYMCENYFDHPNYYKINGRPVIVLYVTRSLERIEGKLEEVTLLMRSAAGKCGHSVYLIGDQIFGPPPDASTIYAPFLYYDALTSYDVYGSMGSDSVYAGADVVDNYYSMMGQWREQANQQNCRFIPAVSPGFNDRGVRLESDHRALSRRLTADLAEGSFFSYSLSKAITLVDQESDNLLLINSFNEWHEDSQIEPAVGETTNIPDLLTQGVQYEGYGDLYLNLLREGTIDNIST